MGRHIVGSFHGMVVVDFVFLDQMVHDLVEVGPHIRIRILVDGECAGGVLHKQVEQSRLGQGLGQMLHHLAGNEVAASPLGGQMECGLMYHFYLSLTVLYFNMATAFPFLFDYNLYSNTIDKLFTVGDNTYPSVVLSGNFLQLFEGIHDRS